jgi:hypothetical protein
MEAENKKITLKNVVHNSVIHIGGRGREEPLKSRELVVDSEAAAAAALRRGAA